MAGTVHKAGCDQARIEITGALTGAAGGGAYRSGAMARHGQARLRYGGWLAFDPRATQLHGALLWVFVVAMTLGLGARARVIVVPSVTGLLAVMGSLGTRLSWRRRVHVVVDAWRVTARDYDGRQLALRHALRVKLAEGLYGHAVQIDTSYGAPFYVLETKTREEAEAVLRWLSRALLIAKGEICTNTTTQPMSGPI